MIRFRLFGPRFLRLPLAAVLLIAAVLGASPAWAQAQPRERALAPELSKAERARRLQERDRLRVDVLKLVKAGRLDEAAKAAVKELGVTRNLMGALHDDVIGSLQFLAGIQEAREDWKAARASLQEVVAIRVRQPDRQDWLIADAHRGLDAMDLRAAIGPAARQRLREADRLNGLQDALYKQGKYTMGIAACLSSIEIRRQLLGENHPEYAASLNNLSSQYEAMGEHAKAEPLLLQALGIWSRALGENHPNYATGLSNLGLRYVAKSDYAKAEPLLRRSLEIRSRVLGRNHVDYATGLDNLAGLYESKGEHSKAEPLLHQALEIRKRGLGENHPDYARSLNNLAMLYQARGDYSKAGPMLRQALEITKRARGENHPDYARGLNNLAELYKAIGDYPKAEPMLRNALEIRKRVLGENHPDYAESLNNLADLYQSRADYPRAQPMLRQALEITKRARGENHPDYARSLNNLAELYKDTGDYPKAEPMLRHALQVWKRAVGENHPAYATSLNNLAGLSMVKGDYGQAELLYRRATEIVKQTVGEDHAQYARSLCNLAVLYRSKGDFSTAKSLHCEALQITKRALGVNHLSYAIDLDNLAVLYKDTAKYAEAEPLYRQGLEIRKRALGVNHPEYAASLNNLGKLYQAMGAYAAALPLLSDAAEIIRRALGENHPHYAIGLGNLGKLHLDMGDYANAQTELWHALEITKRALGENHPDYARSLVDLAGLYQATGDYAKAEELLLRALQIVERALGKDNLYYAESLGETASLYQAMGDYAKAEPLFRQALDSEREALGENHPTYATSLNNLATMYVTMGEYAKAEPLLRRSLDICKKVLGENHPAYAGSLNNLAELYRHTKQYAKAEPLLRNALEVWYHAVGQLHPDYAGSLNNLAVLYMEMGDARAEQLHREALEIRRRVMGEGHPAYAESLTNLGWVYYTRGQLSAAEESLGQGLTILSRWTHEELATLGDRQRISLLRKRLGAMNDYLSIAPAAGIKADELYRYVVGYKGIIGARQDEDLLARDHPELKDTLEQLARARARLAHLAFATAPATQHEAWRQQLAAVRDREESLETELARKSSAFRRVQENPRLGPTEVAAALHARTALVDLFDYVHSSPPAGGKGPLRLERRLVAFVLRRGQPPVLLPLGASEPVNRAVGAWRQALVTGNSERMQAAAQELSGRIWEPLGPHLKGVETVLVSPDGPLSYFPLAALPGKRSGSYLVEDVAIGYVSSAHRLVKSPAAPAGSESKRPGADAVGLLAVGGIDYQADPGSMAPIDSPPTPGVLVADSQRGGFKPLAGTEPEARHVGEVYGMSFPGQQALVMTGAEPTEGSVKQQLGRHWRYLHFATHGFFESPARIAALRAGLKSDSFGFGLNAASTDESASLALAPLLHSGVALVGAARKPGDAGFAKDGSLADREDGILTAEEVQSLDLRGTELVVLSACETGLGQGYYGQGVMGLQRAFQAAGARAVVASLWKVDDAATTVLMEQFYTNLWSKKMSKLEALRQAQLTVLNNPGLVKARRVELAKRDIEERPRKLPVGGRVVSLNPHEARSDPSLWAAFVLSGDVQ